MTIKQKSIGLVILVIAVISSLYTAILYSSGRVTNRLKTVTIRQATAIKLYDAGEYMLTTLNIAHKLKAFSGGGSEEKITELENLALEALKGADDALTQIDKSILSEEAAGALSELRRSVEDVRSAITKTLLTAIRSGADEYTVAEATGVVERMVNNATTYQDFLKETMNEGVNIATEDLNKSQRMVARLSTVVFIPGIVAIIAMLIWMVFSVLMPINTAVNMMNWASDNNNLTRRLEEKKRDEIAAISRGFNRFLSKLQDIINPNFALGT